MCLRGPRLLVSYNVHVSWKYVHVWKYTSHGSKYVKVHVFWKQTHGSTCMEGIRVKQNMHVLTHRNLPTESITLHYITLIFCWLTNTMPHTYGLFSSAHIKSWWISSGAGKFRVKYTIVFWIKLMSRDKLKTILLFGAHAQGEQVNKWQVAAPLEPWDMFIQLLLNAWMVCGLLNVCNYYEWLYAWAPSWLVAVYVHDMCRGTSHFEEFHASLYSTSRDTPRLMLLHVSWKWRFPQKIFEFYTWISACNCA